ncbi:MAG: AI-2E family transporter, partial [Methanothrix sp.]|nr:AI-2E family transporter [Methanothrix sp.]
MHRAQKAVALIFAIAFAAVILLKLLFSYVAPFLCGGLLALVIDPAVGRLEQRGFSRGTAVGMILAFLGIILALGLVSCLTHLSGELVGLLARLEHYRGFIEEYDQWSLYFEGILKGLPNQGAELLRKQLSNLNLKLQDLAQEVLMSIGGLPHFFFGLVVSLFSAYFLSRD